MPHPDHADGSGVGTERQREGCCSSEPKLVVWQMTIATIATMSALLWYWREMVRFYDTRGDGH